MDPGGVSGAEAAVFGTGDAAAVRDLLDTFTRERLGAAISGVLFRSGRIDAVWAIRLDDGRDVVVKAHRSPVDLGARRAAEDAVLLLAEAGFPVAGPVARAAPFRGVVLSAERLLVRGAAGDARKPTVRRSLAEGLAEQVRVLRRDPALVTRAGRGPAWCRFHDGPWPEPHDSIFDFSRTPPDFAWLNDFAAAASARLIASDQYPLVVGHADWCAGNVLFDGSELVGTFDWDLVAATEAHLAGFAAAGFTDGGSGDASTPTPGEVREFLLDYAEARRTRFGAAPFDPEEWRQAAAAASWTLAYNARCQLAFLGGDVPAGSPLDLLSRLGDEYLVIAAP